MPRGVALSTVRTLFKSLIRDAQETNSVLDAEYNALLESTQSELCAAYDWPFLADKWETSVSAGTRYKAIPTSNIRTIAATINFERPVRVLVKNNAVYLPLEHGISADEMSLYDSSLNEAADPIQRWSLDTNTGDASNPDEFEVWPIPVVAQTVRFEGQRVPRAFSADSDKCELDSLLIALFCAADYLTFRKMDNAQLVLLRAQRRLLAARAGLPTLDQEVILGKNLTQSQPQPRRIPIAIA